MIRGLKPIINAPRVTIGVDIWCSEILVAVLKYRAVLGYETPIVQRFSSEHSDTGAFDLGRTLRRAVTDLGLSRRCTAVAAVESSKVVVRQTSLPTMSDRETEAALAHQLPLLVPGSIDDLVFGSVRLGDDSPSGDRNQQRCIVAFTPRPEMLALYAAFKEADLPLVSVELRSVALSRFIFGLPKPNVLPPFGVLMLDETAAELAVFHGDRLTYARTLVGWNSEGEGSSPDHSLLIQDVRRSLLWCRKCRLGPEPELLIVLSAEDLDGLCAGLAAEIGITVSRVLPEWLDGHPLMTGATDPRYAPALGLAVKGGESR